MAMLATVPQAAAAASPSEAAKLRRLDIMLMVSSLRCRFGADNFQADYARFSTNQYPVMQDAFKTLEADYNARMGPARAKKALDSVSVGMANQYGLGHPWLGCGELKSATRELASTRDRARLIAAADEMLGERPPQFASRR
ncbi:S-adenosyl-L-homocysteine hydrolase [Tsuneonella sp. YG55]|uniref:S-adenosyl-L-homocysteine hydrolase n=1 Tax=Tsuneonella litorea TaxID=2976475 RepID=A0A9X2W098_9SPHN|nr:S-adenosyl-L-homocysteine hydrolase [Tsuneonella litorea]MCT2558238.1 S-adenosyl-L-homocysteine hydrolase [Tsuneonella litorea]